MEKTTAFKKEEGDGGQDREVLLDGRSNGSNGNGDGDYKHRHRPSASFGGDEKGIFEFFGWVYHIGVNSIGHEYCHLRFLFIKGKYVMMYKRDPHENPGIRPIRKGVIGPTLMVEELGRRKVNDGDLYVIQFYNRLDESKKGEIACPTAGEARKWMEAFDHAKQQAEYELSRGGSTRNKLNIEADEQQSTAETSAGVEDFSDVFGASVTCHRLVGHNYLQWSQSIKLFLVGRGKLNYITGTIPQPSAADPNFERWARENGKVMSWLINTMSPEAGTNFLLYNTACEIWNAVRETYSSSDNVPELFGIESKATNLKQDGMSVTVFYNTLTSLWQQIDLYESHEWETPTDAALYKKITAQRRIFQFLNGLNREWDAKKSRILGSKPLPSLREVFADIRREERSFMLPETTATEGSALVTQNSVKIRKSKIVCDYCKKMGHLKEQCWKLHGKPTDWRSSTNRAPRESKSNTATSGGSSGFSKQQMEELHRLFGKFTKPSDGNLALVEEAGTGLEEED